MQNSDAMALSAALLSAAGDLTRRIHDGVVGRGFDGVRPAHGFAFARLAPDGATVTELATHLGVTKQAASQLVDEIVRQAVPGVLPEVVPRVDQDRLAGDPQRERPLRQ
ncbi:MarR family transcriptional regulator, partial [Streptomyces nigra]